MDKFLAQFSKNALAVMAITGGIIFIILADPPRSICHAQIEVIKEAQKKFLYPDENSKIAKTTKYQAQRDRCKGSNNPGGCYEFFQNIKALLQDFNAVSNECGSAIGRVSEINKALWEPAELLVRLAWGEKPPPSYHEKFGWLDAADINLFCKLKARLSYVYGEPAWNNFRERMMNELPGAKDLTRNQVWEMALLSENCSRYP